MYKFLFILIFMGCGTALVHQKLVPNNNTQHFDLSQHDWDKVASSQPAFVFNNLDTLINHQMHLLSDAEGLPLFYYADILTPVCIDGLCKPVNVELFWNLLGQYVGYGDYPDKLLTKYDHDLFEQEDYLKLHNLLKDKSSVIGRRRLSQLYDKNTVRTDTIKFKGVEVDAISGATRKEIKESIVEGGLYSCYTLWHLVNGPVTELMRDNLQSIYSPAVEDFFIKSNHSEYQYHAIKKLDAGDFKDNLVDIASFVERGTPLMRSYGLKKMPKELYKDPIVTNQLYKNFSTFDFNSKTLLIDNLAYSNSATALIVSEHLPSLSKNQLATFLTAIQELDALDVVRDNLVEFSKEGDRSYSYLVEDLLDMDE